MNRGLGLFGTVGVVLIVLKLTGVEPVEAWSWWWVSAPLWVPTAVTVTVLGSVAGWLFVREIREVNRQVPRR